MTIHEEGTTPQTIEELKARYERLDSQRQAAQTELTRAEERLKLAKQNARETYGTDDVSELQAKLVQWRQENEDKRAKYQKDLDEIETELQRVKDQHESGR